MKKIIYIFTLIFLSSYTIAQESMVSTTTVGKASIEKHYQQGMLFLLEAEAFSLSADSGALMHDLSLRLTLIKENQLSPLPNEMVNVTGESVEAYRLLPSGTHFAPPATISIPYAPNLIPWGYQPEDIYTYYYDEDIAQWKQLERINVDTTNHVVVSQTTHFTDFINAIIQTPDIPDASAFVPTRFEDMKEPSPLEHLVMVAKPEANNYGSAQVTYPIEIPAGRNGLQPNVSLTYNSGNGNGLLGYGWDMPQPAITIDTRWGVPRYDKSLESEIYTLNGIQCIQKDSNPDLVLPYHSGKLITRKEGDVLYQLRDPQNNDRVIRHGSDPTNYWWEVIDKSGTISYYGKYASDSIVNDSCILKDGNGNIGYWALAEVVDLWGNYIHYDYSVSSTNEIYLKQILYTGHRDSINNVDIQPPYRIFYHYTQRPDIQKNGRLGFVRETEDILCYIDIAIVGGQEPQNIKYKNRRYILTYDDGLPYSILSAVHDYVNCFTNMWPLDNTCEMFQYDCVYNGSVSFEYFNLNNLFSDEEVIIPFPQSILGLSESSSWNVGGTATVGFGTGYWNTNLSVGGNYNHSRSYGKTQSTLMDINGDGLTDWVYIKDNRISFRPQTNINHQPRFGDEVNTNVPATGLSVESSKTNTWGVQTGVETGVLNANVSGGMSYTDTYTTCYFSDVNGDGLPDYVNDGIVYFNRLNSQGDFLRHDGSAEVIVDSSRCHNFYYDGEVEIIPDYIIKDTIISSYHYRTPNCTLGSIGTEPDTLPNIEIPHGHCTECEEAICEFISSGLCDIDLHRGFTDQPMLLSDCEYCEEEDTDPDNTDPNLRDLREIIIDCLSDCGMELPCEECLDFYGIPELREEYEECKRANNCRTLCPGCIHHLLNGDEQAYLICADRYCLNGTLYTVSTPCTECEDICVDDIENCKACINSNMRCMVCSECYSACLSSPEECAQCKHDANCMGGIPEMCWECYLQDHDLSECGNCLLSGGLYCEECEQECLEHPELCGACVNHRCHYDDTFFYQDDCMRQAQDAFNSWRNNMLSQRNVTIIQKGDVYYAHQIDTIYPENNDPDIEAVRVWVAPYNGVVDIHSIVQLVNDTSISRLQSRNADGVRYIIQHSHKVSKVPSSNTLTATHQTILCNHVIAADDNLLHEDNRSSISVQQGDIFFFHLRSNRTHNFDNVNWEQTIRYVGNNITFSSTDDFICSSDNVFQFDTDGTLALDVDVHCRAGESALLEILSDQHPLDSILLDSSIDHIHKDLTYHANETLSLQLSSSNNLGHIQIKPQINFSSLADSISFNQWLAPHVVFTPELTLDSLYYNLFGPLYRGWGQFAYNNTNNTNIIPLQSLYNSSLRYASSASSDSTTFCQAIDFSNADTTQMKSEEGLNQLFNSRNLYNPLDNAWIQMTADISQNRWEAYGRVARVGRSFMSNTRNTKSALTALGSESYSNDIQDEEYDSEVPVMADGQRVTAIRKKSHSRQWNINAGVGVMVLGAGATHSNTKYSVQADYQDMNGDGYPDIIRSNYAQYTMPWGGLGVNQRINGMESYSNTSLSYGKSTSGSYGGVVKIATSNIKDTKFATQVNGSISGSGTISNSETTISYLDINGDGLPDKLLKSGNIVKYALNIGYGFAPPETLLDVTAIDHNVSTCIDGSMGLSAGVNRNDILADLSNLPKAKAKFQMSLSLGANVNHSDNSLTSRLIDVNGDGVLDVVRQSLSNIDVAIMSPQGILQHDSIPEHSLQNSSTLSFGINAGVTVGFPIWFFKVCVGINGSPLGKSTTQVTHDLMDMNGDGLPDIVWVKNDGIHVRYNISGKNKLLKTITNPTGQQIQLDYTLSEPTHEQRGRQWLMSRVLDIDPYAHPVLGCDTIAQVFTYDDPHYDYAEKQFLGYGTTITTDIYTDSIPHSEYRKTIRRYNNSAFIEHGKLIYEGLRDSANRRYREYEIATLYVDSAANPTDDLCSDATIRIGEELHYTRYYEGGDEHIVMTKKYKYDRYHNVREYFNNGDSASLGDELHASIEYDSTQIVSHNLVSLPSKMVVYNNGVANREMQASYQHGKLTEFRRVDLLSERADTTNYEYDSYGLPERVISPANQNGERSFMVLQYDTFSHSLPSKITDHWGRSLQTTYDFLWQTPKSIVYPSGYTIRYTYDQLGRPSCISTNFSYGDISYNYIREGHSQEEHIPYVRINDVTTRSTFCDSRGNILYRRKHEFSYYEKKPVFYDIASSDCFGRPNKTYCNYISDSTQLSADSLRIRSLVINDILDRSISVRWADNTIQSHRYSIGKDAWGVNRLKHQIIDECGRSSFEYKAPQDWVTTSVLPNNTVTTFEYDALGQLLQSTDPDGLSTQYQYDGLGNMTRRTHPDAGRSVWNYDAAGNVVSSATEQQIANGTQTEFEYEYDRLMAVRNPQHPQLDIEYQYDSIGQISKSKDLSGIESFKYDKMGNITSSERLITLPTEDYAYKFKTTFQYDFWGRMTKLCYPDGEKVEYYYIGDELLLVWDERYREYMMVCEQYDANDNLTQYTNIWGHTTRNYDPIKNRLTRIRLYDSIRTLQDITYNYDGVGNITGIAQTADSVCGMGGPYTMSYQYDSLNRLITADMNSSVLGSYSDYQLAYSPSGMINSKSCANPNWNYQYGYLSHDNELINHQIQEIADVQNNKSIFLGWNPDGQLQSVLHPNTGEFRYHWWNDPGQLVSSVDNERCGYYGYDGNGERTYKLTGRTLFDQYNAGVQTAHLFINDAVLYVNPYMVVTPRGYTKYYYNGSQRIAMRIGNIDNLPNSIIDTSEDAIERIANARSYMEQIFRSNITLPNDTDANIRIVVHCDSNMLLPVLSKDTAANLLRNESRVYSYHPDHLGSATWITDQSGDPVQYLHYMPYGELWRNQRRTGYDERYKFTGKERDAETGYDYYPARYLWGSVGIWLSVDPLADKYPWITPYVYTMNNPIKYVDPDGRGPKDRVLLAQKMVNMQIPYSQEKNSAPDFLRTGTTPEAMANMDCSEFVCRVMAGDGMTPTIESHNTRDLLQNVMSDENHFVKSDIPISGDIILWNGHTGIVEQFNEKTQMVTVLHSTRYGETPNVDGTKSYKVSSTCRENYSLKYYRNHQASFYRPVNETPDVLEDVPSIKLSEITIKPLPTND